MPRVRAAATKRKRDEGKGLVARARRPVQRRKVMSIPLGVPSEKWVRLRYVQEIQIDPGVAGIASHYFRANSLFDPDLTGVGHQPMNFDELGSPYQHYTVYGSKITATAVTSGAVEQVGGYMGIFLDDNGTFSFTTASQVIESNFKASAWRAGVANITQPQGVPKLHLGFGTKKFFSVNDIENSLYRAQINANPTEDANFCVWVGSIFGNNPASTTVLVEIEYLAKLSERAFVAQS